MPASHVAFSRAQLAQALDALADDRFIGPLIRDLPAPRPGRKRDPFHALIVAILNQLISRVAAGAIEERLAALAPRPFTPAAMAALSIEQLRGIGLSRTKAACVQACAADALATPFDAKACARLDDAAVAARVLAHKGAGPWTAHMVLIFGLGRPDVMPDGDGGIQRAAANVFRTQDLAKARRRLLREAKRWEPHRSVAAWYLWRSLG